MKCRLIAYHQGRRVEKRYDDHTDAVATCKKLRTKGVKAHVALIRPDKRWLFPPADDDLSERDDGKLWCPFCRAWRYFKVPPFREGAEVSTEAWFMNSLHRQEIAACSWCHISEMDFDVRRANGTWAEIGRKRRRKKRRRR